MGYSEQEWEVVYSPVLQVLARKDSNNLKLQNYFWEEKSAIKTMYGIKSYQGVSKEKSFSFPGFLSVNI